jgi:3-mercaptopyruvate sulfurtransferase SseA
MVTRIDLAQLQALLTDGAQLIEILPAAEYREEHLPGAINLPLRNWTPPPRHRRTAPARWLSTAGMAYET